MKTIHKRKKKRGRYRYTNILPMHVENKEIISEDREYIKEYLLEKLKDNFLILYGDAEVISAIETSAFKPGTDAHDEFAMVMKGDNKFYVVKKTPVIKSLIMAWSDVDEDVYSRLVMIEFTVKKGDNDKEILFDIIARNRDDNETGKDEFYNNLVENLLVDILKMKVENSIDIEQDVKI